MKRQASSSILLVGCCLLLLISGCSGESRVLLRIQEALEPAANTMIETARAAVSLAQGAVIPSETQRLIALSAVSLCYELGKEQWITFRAPVPCEQIKVVTNAYIQSTRTEDPEAEWSYSLDYELSDAASGGVIKKGTYHHRTKLTKFKPRDSSRKLGYTGSFFLDKGQTPTDGRFIIFNMKDFRESKGSLTLRFRLGSMDPEVSGVVVRLYNLEPTSEFRLDRMWLRITPRQKEQLATGNVYPSDLLTDQEKRNIMGRLWIPVAPEGIGGRQYQERKIYVVTDIQGYPVEKPIMPAGVYVDERLAGTLPIPEGGKRVRLAIALVAPGSSPALGDVSLRWYGPTLADRRAWSLPQHSQTETRDLFFQGGLLEINSRDPITVRAAWLQDGSEFDATPENLYTRTYVLHNEQDVKYAQFHVNEKPTPFRTDFRILSQVQIGRRYEVRYAFLDEQHRVIRSGTIDFEAFPSKYDRAILGSDQVLVSDAVSFFFNTPAATASVVFHCSEPVLINAYTRPPDHVKETRAPEDFYREIPLSVERDPVWFSVLPENHKTLTRESRSVLLRTQLRPPQDDQDVLAGRFFWESFRPTDSWAGQYILTPQDENIPFQRQEALLTGCRKLPVGEPLELDIQSDQGLAVVRPILVFLRPDASDPFSIGLTVDGEPLYESEVTGSRGIVWLPPIVAGRHRVRIQAPIDCSILMNSIASEKPDHMLRFGCLLGNESLNVEYTKRSDEDETLTMRYFSRFGELHRAVMRVRLMAHVTSGQGPLQGFTTLDRRFTIRPSDVGPFPVLNSPRENVDAGQSLFFPIHGDIPAGSYRLQVDLEEGASGYVVFSRILPGMYEERLFREETVLRQDLVRRRVLGHELP